MSWTYTDTADQVIAVTECTAELVGVHIGINARDGRSVTICIPADKRRNAAQAVAGPDYRVVPAAEAAAPDGALSLIADVLGTDDLGDVLPGVERLKRENETLRAEVAKLRKHRDELRQRISDNAHAAHARLYETAQPDCPLTARAEQAEAEVARLRTATGMADELGARITDERNEAWRLLAQLADPSDCTHDHHGYCQAHGWTQNDPPCPHARAKLLLHQVEQADETEGTP